MFVSPIQQALGKDELENAYWSPGTENPTDGLTEVRNDMAPLSRLLESGCCNPGFLRPLKGVVWEEYVVCVARWAPFCMRTSGRTGRHPGGVKKLIRPPQCSLQ